MSNNKVVVVTRHDPCEDCHVMLRGSREPTNSDEDSAGVAHGRLASSWLTQLRTWLASLRLPEALSNGRTICGAALVLSMLAAALYAWRAEIGTDDALIYLVAARNMAQGAGPVLNPGDRHVPVTGMLWLSVLAGAHRLVPALELTALARALAALCVFGSCLLLTLALKDQAPGLALISPAAVATVPMFYNLVGLETPLLVLMTCATLWAWWGVRSWPATWAILAVACFCRGDVVVLALPLAVQRLWEAHRDRWPYASLGAMVRELAGAGILLCVGVWLQWTATGTVLPRTLAIKVLQGTVGPWPLYATQVLRYLEAALTPSVLLLPLAVLGVVALGRPGATLASASIIHWILYAILGVADYPWYSWLLQLTLRLSMVAGVATVTSALMRRVSQRRLGRIAGVLGMLLALALAVGPSVVTPRPPSLADDPSVSAAGCIEVYRKIAAKLCDADGVGNVHTELGAPVVLGEEVGALAYYCRELEIRDVNGLASPGATADNLNNWEYWVTRYRPRFLVRRGNQGAQLRYPATDATGQLLHLTYDRALIQVNPGSVRASVYLLVAVAPPAPRFARYVPGARVQLAAPSAERYLWEGWSIPERDFRWSVGKQAQFLFSIGTDNISRLRLQLACFGRQQVTIKLNDCEVTTFVCSQRQPHLRSSALPAECVSRRNRLTFLLPDARSPMSIGESRDTRQLAVAVSWLELE